MLETHSFVAFAGEWQRRVRCKADQNLDGVWNRQAFTDTCEKWSSVGTMMDYPIYSLQGGRSPFFNSQFPDECSRDFLMDTLSLKNMTFWKMKICCSTVRCLKWGESEWRGFKCTQDPRDYITLMSCCIYWSMTNRFLILKDRSDWSKWTRQPVIGQWRRTYFWTVGVSGRVLSFVKRAVTGSAWQSHGKNRGWLRGNTLHYSVHDT